MILLIQGEIGVGKTTLIRRLLGDRLPEARGFWTRKEAEEALHRLCEAAPPAILLNGMRNATTFLSLIHREFPGYRPAVVTHCNFCTELLENPLLEGVIYSDTAELVRRSVAAAVELARYGRTENVVIPSQFVPQSEFHRIRLPEGRIGLTGSE